MQSNQDEVISEELSKIYSDDEEEVVTEETKQETCLGEIKVLQERGFSFISFSKNPKERRSNIYDLRLNQFAKINGEQKYAYLLKPGDSIVFDYFSIHGVKTIFIQSVAYVEYSSYMSTCVHEDCEIGTSDGMKKIKDVVVGDYVQVERGFSKVTHILATQLDCPYIFYQKGDLLLTEYHPVKINGKWTFPRNCKEFKRKVVHCNIVYSLVLEDKDSFLVDGTPVISLGHGIENDEVATHPFFGTQAVISKIEQLSNNNVLIVRPNQIVYDVEEGIINDIM